MTRGYWVQGSMSAMVPIAADVVTRDWLQSGMVVQLLQMRSPSALSASESTGQDCQSTDSSKATVQRCIARAVLQADALLDGTTLQWSSRLKLLTEVPLFDANRVRLGLENVDVTAHEVCRHTCAELYVNSSMP